MSDPVDDAIDDLVAAASLPEPRRGFELDVCRRKLEEQIDKLLTDAEAEYELELGQ